MKCSIHTTDNIEHFDIMDMYVVHVHDIFWSIFFTLFYIFCNSFDVLTSSFNSGYNFASRLGLIKFLKIHSEKRVYFIYYSRD